MAPSSPPPPARRPLPQPESSTRSGNRKQAKPKVPPASRRTLPLPIESSRESTKSRKSTPQKIDISFRNTEKAPGEPVPPVNSPIAGTSHPLESRYSYASLSRRGVFEKPERQHSFRAPTLTSIPSQTEEGEEFEEAGSNKDENRDRDSRNGNTNGYILSLAAQAAELQLREQAMAAYPNENLHEPVDHFAVDRDTDESDSDSEGVGLLSRTATYPLPGSSRRESAAGWDVAEMRKHKEMLDQQRKEYKEREQTAGLNRKKSTKEHNQHHHHEHQGHKRQSSRANNVASQQRNMIGGYQKDDQMKPMHKAASPPMAGENLVFPKCPSPRQTRLDVGNYPGAPSFLTAPKSREHSGLWTPQGGGSRQNSKSGLWMGVCATSNQKPANPAILQTGLLTPDVERDDPFAQVSKGSIQQMPPSPPTSVGSNKPSCLDTVLSREQTIEEEFHDGFITQIYNYLSLGYPALARKYDFELSKISRIPIEDLRQDDRHANAKGYVGAPEGTGGDIRGMQDGQCERWTALRLYVREWARQQPLMGKREGVGEDWGARARKGSWAI